LNALGLIDEIMHFVVGLYREQRAPQVLHDALAALDARLGPETVDATLERFTEESRRSPSTGARWRGPPG